MSNTILTASVVAKEALDILTNNLVFVNKVNRSWEGEFEENVNGYKKGQTVNIRRPARFTSTVGTALTTQDQTEVQTSITVSTQRHIDTTFTTQELTLSLSDFSERVIEPAIVQLANDIDTDALTMYNQVHNLVGTPGTTPNSFLSIGNAYRRLNEEAAPTKGLTTLLEPGAGITMADALKGVFVGKIAEEGLEEGFITKLANTSMYMAQGIRFHTVGTLGGTPLVNGANQTGTSLATKGWTAAAANRLKKGDVFTLAGVYAVNPLTRQTTNVLRCFLCTADFASDGSGNGSVSIYPAITTSGALQTVTASPADSAAITILTGSSATSYPQNLMFHKDAFAFCSVPLLVPNNVHFKAQERHKGITLRIVQDYTISNDSLPCRIDVLYGYNTVFPELGCRITG
jgi:hypothetical protein